MSAGDVYEVFALRYWGRSDRPRLESFIFADNHEAPHPIDYFVWVIRNGARTILIDTGFDRAEGARRKRDVSHEPAEVLNMFGISPDSIETAVITHLHYDHAGTLAHFPNARFHLQAAEMAYATGPCMCNGDLRMPYTAEHVCDMVRHVYSGRVTFHDGDAEIAPNVRVHRIGGHTGGIQCVSVLTARGWVVLASDVSHFYENFERRKLFPIVLDAAAMIRGFERLEALADSPAHIVPGHDPLVCARYPAVNADLDGFVYRLDAEPRG